ncbi:MAG: HDOD domain-containing protein [Actinomycetota bacterium]
MNADKIDDKTGQELAAQRFQMLQDIARELAGEVTFPTCFDVSLRLRKVLNSPDSSIRQICTVITADPLIYAKLLALANSAAFNAGGSEITDIKVAVQRLGINTVRSAAMAVVMKQMLQSKGLVEFQDLTKKLWQHSVMTASAASVLARKLTRMNPDDALLAGLVHDIGAFYMLYRAAQYEELRARPETLRYLVVQWHESIGQSLLNALGVPEHISAAVLDHDHPRPMPQSLQNLSDVIFVANAMAGGSYESHFLDMKPVIENPSELAPDYLALVPEIQAHTKELQAALV